MLTAESIATLVAILFSVALLIFGIWALRRVNKRWDSALAYAGCLSIVTAILIHLPKLILGTPWLG